MADDINKSNKPPMNGGIKDIGKHELSAYKVTSRQIHEELRMEQASEQLQALDMLPDSVIERSRDMQRLLRTAPNTIASAGSRIMSMTKSQRDRANEAQTRSTVNAYSESTTNSLVGRTFQNEYIQNKSLALGGESWEQLEQRRTELNTNMKQVGATAIEAASGLFGEKGIIGNRRRTLNQAASSGAAIIDELGSIELAQKNLKASGRDPESRLKKANSIGQSAENLLNTTELQRELSSGGISITGKGGESQKINTRDLGAATVSSANDLAAALKALQDAVNPTAEDLANMRKEVNRTSENFEKLEKAAAAAGNGGGPGAAAYANAAGGMFNAVGSGIQQIAVSQRLGQMANIAGYANIENQKYDQYKAGRAGDVMSQMLSTQWGESEEFGKELKTGQQAAVAAYAAGGVAQTVAGGAQFLEGAAEKANPLAYAAGTAPLATEGMLQGAQNFTQGLTTTAVNSSDLLRGVTTNAAAQQGINARQGATREVLKVSAEQLQGFRDYGIGMSVAAQGMGGRGDAFLKDTTSAAGIQKMVNMRISPEQMAQMTQQGVATMGSQFTGQSIEAARGLERSGFGSMAENMQRQAALAGATAGGNNPAAALGTVLESAFSKSLDSSKAISAMVDNTAQMAASSGARAMGVDMTAASASILAANINPNDKNQEYAVNRAMTAQELNKNLVTNTDVSFAGMANTARVAKSTGLKGLANVAAVKLTPEELKSMQTMTEAEADKFLVGKGIDYKQSSMKSAGALAQQLTKDQISASTNTSLSIANLSNAQRTRIDAALQKGGKGFNSLSREDQVAYNQVSQFEGFAGGGEEKSRAASAVVAPGATAADKTKAKEAMEGKVKEDSELAKWDKLRTSGAKQLAEQTLEATKIMGGALKALTSMNDRLEKEGASGAEGKFKDAAAVSAATFGKSTIQFEKSVGDFDTAVTKLVGKAGLSGDTKEKSDAQVKKLTDKAQAEQNAKPKPK